MLASQGVVVEPNGQSVVVGVVQQGGGVPVAYADRYAQSTIALPATITVRTTFFFEVPAAYTVSAKVGGLENANGAGGTQLVDLSSGGIASLGIGVPVETQTVATANFLTRASNLSDLAASATARTNLGLGNVENVAASSTYAAKFTDAVDLCSSPYSLNPGDDATTAIQTAFNLAATNRRSTDIYFSKAGTYTINGPQQTGTVLGWAYSGQILLPAIPSGYGVAIRLRGSSAPPYFGQYNYSNSTKLVSNSTSTTGYIFDTVPDHAAWAGSVAPWSELLPIFQDIDIESTGTATVPGGVNVFCCEAAIFKHVTINGSQGAGGVPSYGLPAIVMPQINNSGDCALRDVQIRNWGAGVMLTEHTILDQVRIVFSDTAFVWGQGGHLNTFTHVNVEQCKTTFRQMSGQLAPTVGRLLVNGTLDLEVGSVTVRALFDTPIVNMIQGDLQISCPASGGWPWISGSLTSPHLGSMNLYNIGGNIGGLGGTLKAIGTGWMNTHPTDSFRRIQYPQTGGLGTSWPTYHPWALRKGSFTIASNGVATAPAATPAASAIALVPARQTSRTGFLTFTAPASGTWDVRLHMHRLQGTGQDNSVELIANSSNSGYLAVALFYGGAERFDISVGSIAALAAGGQHTIAMRLTYGFNGLPRAVDAYLDGTLRGSYIFTAADIAGFATGGSNFPSVSDGVELRDGVTSLNAFEVIDASSEYSPILKTSSQVAAAATMSTGMSAAVLATTSATSITTLTSTLGAGEVISFKAQGGPITFATGGNIALPTSPLTIAQDHTATFGHFSADGASAEWRLIAST